MGKWRSACHGVEVIRMIWRRQVSEEIQSPMAPVCKVLFIQPDGDDGIPLL